MTGGKITNPSCVLCGSGPAPLFADLQPRTYFRCATCALVFLDPAQFPSAEEERAEYDLHNNDPSDVRYRTWLAKLTDPLVRDVPAGSEGLDFGSGPGPTIATMLTERGFDVVNYDPFYAPDRAVLARTYDFISCTETAEHFHDPAREFALLSRLLRPHGRLGVMTELRLPETDFSTWRYRLQPSHVVFYAPETMAWIAQHFCWSMEIRLPNVTVFDCHHSTGAQQ